MTDAFDFDPTNMPHYRPADGYPLKQTPRSHARKIEAVDIVEKSIKKDLSQEAIDIRHLEAAQKPRVSLAIARIISAYTRAELQKKASEEKVLPLPRQLLLPPVAGKLREVYKNTHGAENVRDHIVQSQANVYRDRYTHLAHRYRSVFPEVRLADDLAIKWHMRHYDDAVESVHEVVTAYGLVISGIIAVQNQHLERMSNPRRNGVVPTHEIYRDIPDEAK